MGGNVVNPVSWVAPGGNVLKLSLAKLAGLGALQGSLAPVEADKNFLATKAMQAGVGGVVAPVAGRIAAGFKPTEQAARLMDEGIRPPFGQSMGGLVNKAEELILVGTRLLVVLLLVRVNVHYASLKRGLSRKVMGGVWTRFSGFCQNPEGGKRCCL